MRRSSASGRWPKAIRILATWIVLTGSATALIGAKTMACLCGAVLYVTGVHHVLAGLSALYLFAAVVPWLRIFAQFM